MTKVTLFERFYIDTGDLFDRLTNLLFGYIILGRQVGFPHLHKPGNRHAGIAE